MVDSIARLKRQRRRRKLRCRRRQSLQSSKAMVRIVVFRSNRAIYAQALEISNGKTLCGVSSARDDGDSKPTQKARKVGSILGSRLQELNVTRVAFDRSGYKFHGRVAAVVDGLRDVGISV